MVVWPAKKPRRASRRETMPCGLLTTRSADLGLSLSAIRKSSMAGRPIPQMAGDSPFRLGNMRNSTTAIY